VIQNIISRCNCVELSFEQGVTVSSDCCVLCVLQVKDAVALCQFFSWLEKEAPNGMLTEVAAAEYAEMVRK